MIRSLSGIIAMMAATLPLLAECRLPDVSPGALDRLSPDALLESGHFLRAEKVLEAASGAGIPGQNAWMLSRAKAALGRLGEAMTLAESAIAADGTNPAYHVQAAAVAGRLAEKAGLLKRLTYAKRAKQALDVATALDARNIEARWGLMMYFYAAPALVGGDKAKAQQIGESIASDAPALGRYYQGRLAMEMKDPDKAEAFYRQSIIENPLQFDSVAALAMLYVRSKPDQAKAERWACDAVHIEPVRGDAWGLLARVYSMCGCWTEAIDAAERAEAIDPDDLVPWYTIAEVSLERGVQTENAAVFLRRYLAKPVEGNQPSEAVARMHLGSALAKLGQTGDGVRELQAALELDASLEGARAELKRIAAAGKR